VTPEERSEIEKVYRQLVGSERVLRKVLGLPPPLGYTEAPADKSMAEMVSEHAAKTFGTG
jgi:hypothetical protein